MDNSLNEAISFDISIDSVENVKITDLGLERADLLRNFTQPPHPLVNNLHDKIDFSAWENIVVSDLRELTTIYLMTAKIIAKSELTAFANDSELNDRLKLIFGDSYNTELSDLILQKFAQEDFRELPKIETVDAEEIAGANGAFADTTNSIYLSNQFLEANFTNPQVIAEVLLEEVGHYLDSQINREDTPGDEGEIFSLIVGDKAIEVSQPKPKISIAARDDNAEEINKGENPNYGRFTIARTGDNTEDLTVNYKISGTATNGKDYKQISDSTVIPAGKQKVSIPIYPIDDELIEGTEKVTLTIEANSQYKIDKNKSDSIAIADNDSLPHITVTKPNGREKWEAGNPHALVWKDNIGENVKIDLYKYDKFYQILLKSSPSDGIETITLPAALPNSDDYSIKVGSVKHHQINDLSDGNFALDPEFYVRVTEDDISSDLIWQDNIQGDLKVDLYKDNKFVTTLLTPDPYRDNQIISLKDLEPILSELSKDGDYSLKVSLVNPDGSTTLVGKADALL